MLKSLYTMGVFDPANAAAAEVLLDAMDFPGIENLRARIAQFLRDGRSESEPAAKRGKSAVKNDTAPDLEALTERARHAAERVADTATKNGAI